MAVWRCSFILFVFILICHATEENYDWLCTEKFCQDVKCPPLPTECQKSNKALVVPSFRTCNCCNHCFLFKKKDEDCSHIALTLPNIMCGPGLTCDSSTKKCKTMIGPDVHFYSNYECDDQQCYCTVINDKGSKERIFGKFRKKDVIVNEKQCECSIVAYKAKNQVLKSLPFKDINQPSARCLPNGKFDPLQCIGEMCGCVDEETGRPDKNGFIYHIQSLERNNPSCFDPSRHTKGEYYTDCEKRRNYLMNEINEGFWYKINFIHFKTIDCNPDGSDANGS